MTIEKTLDRIATALEAIASSKNTAAQALPVAAVPAAAVPMPAAPVPMPPPAPAFPMPPPAPAFPMPPPAPAPACPITTPETLMAYAMEKWRTLGPIKGGEIQAIVASMGATNINSLTVAQYPDFYAKCEAIK